MNNSLPKIDNNRMKIKLLFFVVSVLLLSCSRNTTYNDSISFTFNDFESSETLEGNTLNFDSLIMRPTVLKVVDSFLIVIEPTMDKLFNVFNLKNNKLVGKRIDRGQGPGDMIRPKFLDGNDNVIRIVDLATFTFFEYEKVSFLSQDAPVPVKRIKLESPVFIDTEIVGNNIVGYFDDDHYQLKVFDMKGKPTGEIAEYPEPNISFTDLEKKEAFYMNFTTNSIDRIAICYYLTDLIEIYKVDGELEKRLHGPEQFISRIALNQDADLSSDNNDIRDAYFAPENFEDNFYVLYNGGLVGSPGHSSSCKHMFSFSWDGRPQTIYNLDDPVFSFTIDGKNRKIYGISNTPEYHIVEYSF